MKLTIVIPALNEEDAIGSIIERCLAARSEITSKTKVTEVQVVVVSDGSTDRTVEIAQGYSEVEIIIFEKNQGYGAAIKAGWKLGDGDLLSFLDADGTCDPLTFVTMCQRIEDNQSDVILGSRMSKESKMPLVRRVGNTIFALLLGLLARKKLTDTASGMRVVRKTSLPRILPLPDGLHFTPAMSARCLMEGDIKIEEVTMSYSERVGRSKLSVVKDGLRFLRVILSAAAYVRPSRLTVPIMALLSLVCLGVGLFPLMHYLENQSLLEWMIYRFIFISMLGTFVVTLYCFTIIAEHMIALGMMRYMEFERRPRPWWRAGGVRFFLGVCSVCLVGSAVLVWPGFVSLMTTGEISFETMHWSRVMVAAFFGINFVQFLATASMLKIIGSLHVRQGSLVGES